MNIRRPLCVYAIWFILVLSGLMSLTGGIGDAASSGYEGREVTVEGVIDKIEDKNGRSAIHIKNVSFPDKHVSEKIIIYPTDEGIHTEELHLGQKILIRGTLSLFERAYNRGEFDMRDYYARKHYGHVIRNGEVLKAGGSYNVLTDGLYRLKLKTKRYTMNI